MTEPCHRCSFPEASRLKSSEDFGRLLRSKEPGSFRFGRDCVSVCAQVHGEAARVRFGFTVGKHNVPRAVDRALVKRIFRECVRQRLQALREQCVQMNAGVDVTLRLRAPLKGVGSAISVRDAKSFVRTAAEKALDVFLERLPRAVRDFEKCRQKL